MKNIAGFGTIILTPLTTLFLWVIALPISGCFSNLETGLYSLGQMSGLVGVSLFAVTLVLNTRLKILEDTFGGLNKVFPVHHYTGRVAAAFIATHPLCLLLSRLAVSLQAALDFLLPPKSLAYWAGPIALVVFAAIIVTTLWVRLPYHLWRLIHQFIGVSFMLAIYHLFNLGSDTAAGPLQTWLILLAVLGIGAYLYRTVLGKFQVKKYPYVVHQISQLTPDTWEISLSPQKQKLSFAPGQFVFVKFPYQHSWEEQHAFSIASAPANRLLKLVVKSVGDFTTKVPYLKKGQIVPIEGPYGRFGQNIDTEKQIWIAGGIGITPFLSMIESVPENVSIDFFYSVPAKNEAIGITEINREAEKRPNFRFSLRETTKIGRLTAGILAKQIPNLTSCRILLCGPYSMITGLKKQLVESGITGKVIITEEFRLAP